MSTPNLDHIAPPLRRHAVRVDDLMLDPTNARTHPERQLRMLAATLERSTQTLPLLYQTIKGRKVVRVGNGRLLAARRLRWTHVAAIEPTLSKDEWDRHALADNTVTRDAGWDDRKLRNAMRAIVASCEGITPADLGYSEDEFADLLASTRIDPTPKGNAKPKTQMTYVCTCPHCGFIWDT